MKIILVLLPIFLVVSSLNCNTENWLYSENGKVVITSTDIFNATLYEDNNFVTICQNVNFCIMQGEQIDRLIIPMHNYSVLVLSYCEMNEAGEMAYFDAEVVFYENSSRFRILMLEFMFYSTICYSAIMISAILPICILLYLSNWCTRIYIIVTYAIGLLSCVLLCLTLWILA